MSSSMPAEIAYKGKYTRSWHQLPPEVIRIIATHYLLDVATNHYCPQTWEQRDQWPRRMLYTVFRDAIELEKLMSICPAWNTALQNHYFWHSACAAIDPNDVYANHRIIQPPPSTAGSNVPAPAFKVTPYKHYRGLISCSCFVCRINYPFYNNGLGTCKRSYTSYMLGSINLCRDHRKNTFCGLCLRESPPMEADPEYSVVCCVENEDEETWPHVESTCRSCRMEWLWRRASSNPMDAQAVGGNRFATSDWETRQALESFIELGEGTIQDVFTIAREKQWLRKYTKLNDMLMQAVAASRYATRAENGQPGYGSGDDLSEEDEDDVELLSMTEEAGGVRELAVSDWARNRILDGHWVNPADQWYNNGPSLPPYVPAEHPCPWNRDAAYTGALDDGETMDNGDELEHPRPKTVRAEFPPTFALCENACRAFSRCMHDILLPAMNNIVRRIVIECTADGTDPAIKTSRMTMEEVLQELRDEATWFNGIDWLERRANRAKEERDRLRAQAGDDDDSSSSRSDGSHTTSPVLSTTTLQTTPSPPPSSDVKDSDAIVSPITNTAPVIPIPVGPVLKSPQLIHPIPYIPASLHRDLAYSYDSVRSVWREACQPLYQCRCSICERMMIKLNKEAGNVVPAVPAPTNHTVSSATNVAPTVVNPPTVHTQVPATIVLSEVSLEDMQQLEQEEEEDENDSIIDDSGESEKGHDEIPSTPVKDVPAVPRTTAFSRKRSSDELDADYEIERTGAATPPKRIRVEGTYSPSKVSSASPPPSTPESPSKLRKRSSEELEDEDGLFGIPMGNGDAKRPRSEAAADTHPRHCLPLPRTGKLSLVGSKPVNARG